jgi:hypothetical protein
MSSTYAELLVAPMPAELTRLGVEEVRTAEAVDAAVKSTDGTLMMVVNSVCGYAAGKARPGITMALQHAVNQRGWRRSLPAPTSRPPNVRAATSPATPLRRRALDSCGTGRSSSSSSDGPSRIRP